MGLLGRNSPRAVTGSASRISRANASDIVRLRQEWQDRAMGYYDMVPEVWFASQFYARGLSKVELFPAIRDEKGEVTRSDDPKLLALWDRVQDQQGGRKTMSASYGRLMFLIGEGLLLATAPTYDTELWEIVSPMEVKTSPDGMTITRTKADSGKVEVLKLAEGELTPGSGIVYRMWRRHPRRSSLADSPLRASLDVCEELVLLTLGIRARVRSRLSGAGILAIDADVTLPAADEQDASDEDAFIRKVGEHLMEPIGDEGSASAITPYLMRIPTAGRRIEDLIHHFQMHNPREVYPERGMRSEAVTRLATGLDLPPELLLGLSGANHWTSWQIDEQSWELLQPTVDQYAADMAGAYLRPAAKDDGINNWEQVCLGYTESEIVSAPDRTKDAAQAHDRLVLSDAAYRSAGGWREDDAPDEAEWQKRVGVKIKDPSMIPGATPPPPGNTETHSPPDAPPDAPPAPSQPANASLIAGAAEYAVERARELAGSRIRTRTKSNSLCQSAINGFPNSLVANVLGQETTVSLAGDELELVAGAGEGLARVLLRRGVEEREARRLGLLVEEHAAATLYLAEPPPLPFQEATS